VEVLATLFAAIAAAAASLTVYLAWRAHKEAREFGREQVRMRRLAQLERIEGLIVHFGEVARAEEGRGGGTSRLPVIRRRLEVALAIFASLGGQPLPECLEQATLTRTNPATPVFPSLSEAFQIVERCLGEIRTALDHESLIRTAP